MPSRERGEAEQRLDRLAAIVAEVGG